MFNFILSELLAPEWLIKTSLIDVQHKVRDLVPYQNYIRDNQDFVSEYIQEVKPYHVQVREFNLTYDGIDNFQGSLTDFDLPAYYDTNLTIPQYVSPILLPYEHATAQAFNTLSDTAPNSTLWPEWPYSQWFDNYLLHVDSITVTNQGTGYTIAPTVLIVPAEGDTGSGAEATAVLNSSGNVVSITLINGGSGYRSTPTVAFDGGNGTGVAAYPQMDNGLVRSFRTVLKYDRYQYQTSVLTWSSDGTYENGTLVRYDDRVWQADSADGSSAVIGPVFNLEDWTLVDAATLSGVNRTMGFYVPGVNEFGLDLQLLVDGTSYPGVQVWGDYFLGSAPASPTLVCTATNATTNEITCVQTARLSLGDPIRFYGTVFGGIVAGTVYYVNAIVDATHFTVALAPDGLTFSLTSATGTMIADVPEPIDATYASSFTDMFLGLRPTDINVDGGEFIGPYEGHAPEELVNGSEYDTLDFRVYTRPGADWTGDGHGFAIGTFNYVYDGNALYWGTLVQNPVNIEVSNENTNSDLTPDVDYVVDWEAQTITAVPGGGIANGDVISVTAYEMGGGNQLYRGNYNGTEVNNSVVIPVNANEIYELVLFVNGTNVSGATWTSYANSVPWTYENSYAAQTVVEDNQLYYRALQSVPPGILLDDPLYWIEFVPTVQSTVRFPYPMANVKYATTTSLFGTYGYVYNNGTNGVGATLTNYNVFDDYTALTIDGVIPLVGDRILVKDETGIYTNDTTQSATFNGIYTVTRVGNSTIGWILTRATDFVDSLDIPSAITLVTSGSTNAATRWVCTSNPSISVGTTEIDWTRFIGTEAPYGPGDGISITVMGVEDPQYSWSTAVTQYRTATESDRLTNSINLDNSMQGTNVANLVVTVNGKRLQPPEGIEWTGDGTSSSFGLPQRGGGYPQSAINAYTDIQVWVDNVLQVQNYGAIVGNYYVTNYDGSNTPGRQVVFFTPPADGAQILISVSTIAQYTVVIGSPNRLLITPLLNLGDQIAITSWNDTSQQDPLTLVFVGPVVTGLTVIEPYDSTGYSFPDAANDTSGSFDFSIGVAIPTNDFNLGREGILANRLWVTLDGNRLYPGVDYAVQGQYLILGSGIIGSAQVLAVTEFTESVVPGAMAFRLFQDMRGVQTTFRITASTTTTVAQAVSAVADIIYVANVAALSEPNLTDGIFGVVTIDGERILYRERNLSTNSITGLQRGTAGTAATSHSVNAEVYDMGLGNRQPQEFQNYIVSDTSTGDGSTTIFYAPTIEFDLSDSSFEVNSIEVYVGGNRARVGYYAGQFVIGQTYTIASVGSTNWHAIGLPSDVYPLPGVVFTATGAGSGTGVAGTSLASNYYQVTDYNPLAIQFLTANDLPAPGAGVEVVILQRRGVTWYAPGNGTPSNGEALQITDTNAARFLRGL